MNCPHCNISFYEEWTQTHVVSCNDDNIGQTFHYTSCPNCGKLIIKVLQGQIDKEEEDFKTDDRNDYIFDIEFLVYPSKSDVELSEDIPEQYRKDLIEAQTVLVLSPKASAALSRRLLQKILTDELDIKGTNLSKQIEKFLENKHVPTHILDTVDAIRNIGNFSAHPIKETNTGEIVEVELGEADWAIEVIKSLFDFIFIQPKRIKRKREELNLKLKNLGRPEMK